MKTRLVAVSLICLLLLTVSLIAASAAQVLSADEMGALQGGCVYSCVDWTEECTSSNCSPKKHGEACSLQSDCTGTYTGPFPEEQIMHCTNEQWSQQGCTPGSSTSVGVTGPCGCLDVVGGQSACGVTDNQGIGCQYNPCN